LVSKKKADFTKFQIFCSFLSTDKDGLAYANVGGMILTHQKKTPPHQKSAKKVLTLQNDCISKSENFF
jgi:hypothetical protein